jgi:endonuclease IV
MKDRRFAKVPMVHETPKDPEPKADMAGLALLRNLRAGRR